ncbi:hypothetical protein GCM10025864_10470 [Luteimicrobium album]|uniref:Avirulence D protein (AvrD) n=1 Tax=Luteimicrobium album TaxID=1054550 RepID=A0ABQ6I007_9MICO|nr:AvrD family protein [Luteimicrobium album]GMA23288.1 hypothetical protein GCM10025864_10470 [Luteimicrobium album]
MPEALHDGLLASLEDLLGPSEGRYFAAGYRNVRHTLSTPRPEGSTLTATATAHYPRDWSTDGSGRPRTPHLSSVDAVVLTTLALEDALGPGAARQWVRDVELRSGTEPWWDLDTVPVTVSSEPSDDGARYRGTVGNIRAVVHLAGEAAASSGAAVPPDVGPSVYHDAYRRTECTTWVRPVDRVAQDVRATHEFAVDGPDAPSGASGIESAYHPALTVVDYLVTMGQLTQVLVYELAGTARAAVGNLWMRSLRILGVPARRRSPWP